VEAIRWDGTALSLIDQRLLPHTCSWITVASWHAAADAIRDMVVRGAPAIAITAAYGMAMAVSQEDDRSAAHAGLLAARPTAVNLQWALDRIATVADVDVRATAESIHAEDRAINEAIGQHGAPLLSGGILTICNTGSLATGGHGTALGVIRTAASRDPSIHVYALETRPYLQGARLTAYECMEDGIRCTLLTDGMAGARLVRGDIGAVVVGCDRVAVNGDTANKIGTYGLAVLAHHHEVPFYVAMPTSTLDRGCPDGTHIPIEERAPHEVTHIAGRSIAPDGTPVWNPAFDVTPAHLISGWITEHGVWTVPFPPTPSR